MLRTVACTSGSNLFQSLQANVAGTGAAAQGGGDALGERSVRVEDNYGTIITGTQIVFNSFAETNLSQEELAERVIGYLRWLRARTETIELRGIERAGGAPVVLLPLETAYVPLRAKMVPRLGRVKQSRSGKHGVGGNATPFGSWPVEREQDIALNRALGLGNQLVIIGGPGSGKTTVLCHMAWALASSLITGRPEPARSRLGLSMEPSELPLPIMVPLGSFARYRRALPASAPARDRTLAHFISHHLVSKTADFDLPAEFFVQLIKDGRDVLLLLDGLDEVANENERAEVRELVDELVAGREALRVLVTCRTVAYRSGRTALGADFREIAVQPLNYEHTSCRWCAKPTPVFTLWTLRCGTIKRTIC